MHSSNSSYVLRQPKLVLQSMLAAEIQALRMASNRASDEHLQAQYRLLAKLDAAAAGRASWPDAAEYEAVAELRRASFEALRAFLNSVHVLAEPAPTVADRLRLIQRLSASERLWQPRPEDWLMQQDEGSTNHDELDVDRGSHER